MSYAFIPWDPRSPNFGVVMTRSGIQPALFTPAPRNDAKSSFTNRDSINFHKQELNR